MAFQAFRHRAAFLAGIRAELLFVGLAAYAHLLPRLPPFLAFWREFGLVLLHALAQFPVAGLHARAKFLAVRFAGAGILRGRRLRRKHKQHGGQRWEKREFSSELLLL